MDHYVSSSSELWEKMVMLEAAFSDVRFDLQRKQDREMWEGLYRN